MVCYFTVHRNAGCSTSGQPSGNCGSNEAHPGKHLTHDQLRPRVFTHAFFTIIVWVEYSFIHTEHLYSASSRELLRGANMNNGLLEINLYIGLSKGLNSRISFSVLSTF